MTRIGIAICTTMLALQCLAAGNLEKLYGELKLVDDIDCAKTSHRFKESPAGASKVTNILGKNCRVLNKTQGECAYFAYRVGEGKGLKPGTQYVIAVDYPEDAPRTAIVLHGGNEMIRGFHTGTTFGDALHPKYVNNNNESLNVPLSGKYETWNVMFKLHERFPSFGFIRGGGARSLVPKDGYYLTIAQFSKKNIPASRGAAVSRIRLYEVVSPAKTKLSLNLPKGLPQRHLFWREEMSDGVIGGKKVEERGFRDFATWFCNKADVMQFLGMNTYAKDLLEFGACQHWDSSAGGGHSWVYYSHIHKDVWAKIVSHMGQKGLNIMPYYEYAGSKGKNGLGFKRRCKPLARNDAYTHIKWIESANADITDPDTYADFKKMLDLTIVRHKDKANFVGAWLRPRSQIPISFSDATLGRYTAETGRKVSRSDLQRDKNKLQQYYGWWNQQRRKFLVEMRDYLRSKGVKDASVLYTANASESGNSFNTWAPQIVVDGQNEVKQLLTQPAYGPRKGSFQQLSVSDVVQGGLYMKALTEQVKTWGKWEVHHANPPADPDTYKDTEGVMMTHCFNRAYTVADPKTMDSFRSPSGLAMIRHYSLNENMMFDKRDKPKLGYFVVDIERAGPYCMLAEARAMANGDPRFVGYLVGSNYNRGFPYYVRRFNQAFLSLPALPSKVLRNASSDPEVVVRAIKTKKHGTYLAIVNTGLKTKKRVTIKLPTTGKISNAATGKSMKGNGSIDLSFYPCQLRAIRIR